LLILGDRSEDSTLGEDISLDKDRNKKFIMSAEIGGNKAIVHVVITGKDERENPIKTNVS
jgi:hypothetical protein